MKFISWHRPKGLSVNVYEVRLPIKYSRMLIQVTNYRHFEGSMYLLNNRCFPNICRIMYKIL